jgi:periplasmic protein CpxP/Spy
MKQQTARMPPLWRFVALGLLVSAAGAFGIVNMASAHSPAEASEPRHHGRAGMPGLPLLAPGPALDRLLDQVQANDTQREQLRQIAASARADLRAGAESRRADQARMGELFAQPVVDEAAVEALRQKMLARHDRASKHAQTAMLQASKVLTAEQRQLLVAQLQREPAERHGERVGRRHGHGHDSAPLAQ